eukprot:gene18606-20482_t
MPFCMNCSCSDTNVIRCTYAVRLNTSLPETINTHAYKRCLSSSSCNEIAQSVSKDCQRDVGLNCYMNPPIGSSWLANGCEYSCNEKNEVKHSFIRTPWCQKLSTSDFCAICPDKERFFQKYGSVYKMCRNETKLISREQDCDGVSDCENNTDEARCSTYYCKSIAEKVMKKDLIWRRSAVNVTKYLPCFHLNANWKGVLRRTCTTRESGETFWSWLDYCQCQYTRKEPTKIWELPTNNATAVMLKENAWQLYNYSVEAVSQKRSIQLAMVLIEEALYLNIKRTTYEMSILTSFSQAISNILEAPRLCNEADARYELNYMLNLFIGRYGIILSPTPEIRPSPEMWSEYHSRFLQDVLFPPDKYILQGTDIDSLQVKKERGSKSEIIMLSFSNETNTRNQSIEARVDKVKLKEKKKALDTHIRVQLIMNISFAMISLLALIIAVILLFGFNVPFTTKLFIHKNLFVARMISSFIYVIGSWIGRDLKKTRGICTTFLILQYCTSMATFSWMLVEGINLFNVIVLVFQTRWTNHKVYAAIGWADGKGTKIVCPSEEDLLQERYKQALKCPLEGCGKVMSNTSSFKMHMAQTHNHGDEIAIQTFNKAFDLPRMEKKFACPVSTCSRRLGGGKYFPRLAPLRDHYLSAHAPKSHICTKCGAKFGNPRRRDQHVKNCGKIYKCSCGCPFRKKAAVLEHSIKNQHELPECIAEELIAKKNAQPIDKDKRKRPKEQAQLGSHCIQPSLVSPGSVLNNGRNLIAATNGSAKTNAFLVIVNEKVANFSVVMDSGVEDNGTKLHSKLQPLAPRIKADVMNNGVGPILNHPLNQTSSNVHAASTKQANVIHTESNNVANAKDLSEKQSLNNDVSMQKQEVKRKLLDRINGNSVSKLDGKFVRLKKAMNKFVPILKKTSPVGPRVVNNCLTDRPRVEFLNSQQNQFVNINCIPPSDYSDRQADQKSLTSIQDCLQKAAVFVNRTLPKIASPKRNDSNDEMQNGTRLYDYSASDMLGTKRDDFGVCNEDRDSFSSDVSGLQRPGHCFSTKSTPKEKAEPISGRGSFVKYASYLEDFNHSDTGQQGEILAHGTGFTEPVDNLFTGQQDQSLPRINRTKCMKRNLHNQPALLHAAGRKRTRMAPSGPLQQLEGGFNPKMNEFCLDGLSPEFINCLKYPERVEVGVGENMMALNGDTNNQETQTPHGIAADYYNDANHLSLDNIISVFDGRNGKPLDQHSDAFTQTNLDSSKQNAQFRQSMTTGCSTAVSTDSCFSNSAATQAWLMVNNNETQTDDFSDFLADAFTQTRLNNNSNNNASSVAMATAAGQASQVSHASQSCMTDNHNNSIADNHTQTNLSFDNFLVNLNFDDDDCDNASLDASLIPDLADMCTQTNFDPEFKELLEMASAGSQTVISATSMVQAESSNSHTQTRLTFDDLFPNSFAEDRFSAPADGDDDNDEVDDRELNDMYTQTAQTIINDILSTDSFTQTQF